MSGFGTCSGPNWKTIVHLVLEFHVRVGLREAQASAVPCCM